MSKITMNNVSEEITIQEAYDVFNRHNKIKNLSEETLKYYDRCIKNFSKYYDLSNDCKSIDYNLYIGYIEDLQNREPILKEVTINTNLRGIRVIFNFFIESKYIEEFSMQLMKIDKTIKETYSDEELAVILKKPDVKNCSFVGFRTWAMANFALGTGQRISSIINVKINDISFNDREVIIRKTKGRKQLIIPISSDLGDILKEYLQYRGGNQEDYLFSNQFGGKLERNSARDALVDYNHARGVNKTSFHLFRHTFAKLWILNGGDIFTLQRILGHSSIEMVREYVNLFGGDLQLQYDKFNPLDSVLKKQGVKKKTLNMKK